MSKSHTMNAQEKVAWDKVSGFMEKGGPEFGHLVSARINQLDAIAQRQGRVEDRIIYLLATVALMRIAGELDS